MIIQLIHLLASFMVCLNTSFFVYSNGICHDNNYLYIDTYIRQVVDNNPDLSAIGHRVEAAHLAIIRVQTLDDPRFAVQSMSNGFDSKNTSIHFPEVRIVAKQKIPFPGKLSLRGKIQEHETESLRAQEVTTKLDLIFQAKKLFYLYYFNGVALQINQENKELITRFINGALALYQSGKGDIADVLKGEVELEKIQQERLTLESECEMFKAFINALRNTSQETLVCDPVVDLRSHVLLDYDRAVSFAIQNRPELEGVRANIRQENARADLAQREYFPDFDVMGMLQGRKNRMDNTRDWGWGLRVELNVPIWIPQKQRREFLEAESRAIAGECEFINSKNMILAQIKKLFADIYSIEEKIPLYDAMVRTITEALFASEYAYRTGKQMFLAVLDTQRELQDSLLRYEKSRIDREILFAELEREIGGPIERALVGNIVCYKDIFLDNIDENNCKI